MKQVKASAGILIYRVFEGELQFFLVHPGGPFWAKKDLGTWSIPKGEFGADENPLDAAKREFAEETGTEVSGELIELTPVLQKAGKQVYAWAIKADIDPSKIQSNTFKMEWPPKSGTLKSFPEVDKAGWFNAAAAREKINPAQVAFIEELTATLSGKT